MGKLLNRCSASGVWGANKQISNKETNNQTNKQANKQKSKQINTQTHKHAKKTTYTD